MMRSRILIPAPGFTPMIPFDPHTNLSKRDLCAHFTDEKTEA